MLETSNKVGIADKVVATATLAGMTSLKGRRYLVTSRLASRIVGSLSRFF